jgi:large subunit ribosomal protein L15
MSMRIPKLKGFRNPNKEPFAVINLATLNRYPAGSVVTPDDLRQKGLVRHRGRVKVLGLGDIDRALTVKADAFSEAAKTKIEAAGGTVEVLAVSPPAGGKAGAAGRGAS